ncbi:hypothetical protein J2129_000058 [Methanofollis sp. W23]|nr:hypothetical protein [Methanofollis sp. W23]
MTQLPLGEIGKGFTMNMILTILFPGFYENLNHPDFVEDDMQMRETSSA